MIDASGFVPFQASGRIVPAKVRSDQYTASESSNCLKASNGSSQAEDQGSWLGIQALCVLGISIQ